MTHRLLIRRIFARRKCKGKAQTSRCCPSSRRNKQWRALPDAGTWETPWSVRVRHLSLVALLFSCDDVALPGSEMRARVESGGDARHIAGLEGPAKLVDVPTAIGHDGSLRVPDERRPYRGWDAVRILVDVPACFDEADVGNVGRQYRTGQSCWSSARCRRHRT